MKKPFSKVGRWKSVAIALIMIFSTVVTALTPFDAYAANSTSDLSPTDQAKSYAYYLALRHCMEVGWFHNSVFTTFPAPDAVKNSDMSGDTGGDADNWNFFNDHAAVGSSIGNVYPISAEVSNSTTIGVINDSGSVTDGGTLCSTTQVNWLKTAAALWGYSTGPELLCALGFVRATNNNLSCTYESSSANNFQLAHANDPTDNAKDVDNFWTQKLGNKTTALSSIALGLYDLYFNSFTLGCGVTTNGTGTPDYKIETYASGSTSPSLTSYYIGTTSDSKSTTVKVYQDTTMSCQQLANEIDSATSSAVLALNHYLQQGGSTAGGLCGEPGVTVDKTTGQACPVTGPTVSSCTVNGIGWIICPVVNFMASISDSIFTFLATNFLSTNVQLLDTSGATHQAWVIMRNIANVAFVIAFLIIIFSQLTGLGVTNYGVKKMLPRVIIAAILVNLSFYICAIAVDLSNILGASLKDLFNSIGTQVGGTAVGNGTSPLSGNNTFANVAGGVLVVVGTAVAGYALIGSLVPVLLAAVVALLMIFFLLIGREVLIVVLIVVSPLAFVAYLLPNTESWFKKWRQALVAMLMLFPIISLVYGLSSLASSVIGSVFTASFNANNTGASSGTGALFGQIVSAAVLVIPLFAVPIILKKSLDGIPAVGKFMGGLTSKANGNLRKKVGESYQNSIYGRGKAARNAARQQFYQNRSAKRTASGGLGAVLGKGVSGLGITANQRAQREAVMRNARGTVSAAKAEELKTAMGPLSDEIAGLTAAGRASGTAFDSDSFLRSRAIDSSRSPAERSAAMHQLATTGRDDALRKLSTTPGVDQTALQEALSANAGSLVGKAPDLIKGNDGAFNSVTGEQLAGFSKDTAAAHMQHLVALHAKATAPGALPKDINAFKTASDSFNSAVQDITMSPALQGTFNASNGKAIESVLASSNPAFQAYASSSLTGLAAIQPDGKIR